MFKVLLIMGGRYMKKRKWIVAVVSLCILVMGGCNTPNPQYNVKTYEELKDELKDDTDILFPDISRYENEQIDYVIYHKPANKNDKHGYKLFWGLYANDGEPSSETALSDLHVFCNTLEFIAYDSDETKGSWAVYPEFKPNMEVDGVVVEYEHYDSYVDKNDPEYEELSELFKFPDGTYESSNYYKFEYRECQYKISGIVRLLPEEQLEKDIDQKVEKGKEELLEVIRSIIKQGGEEE